jgi:hypothetical protein
MKLNPQHHHRLDLLEPISLLRKDGDHLTDAQVRHHRQQGLPATARLQDGPQWNQSLRLSGNHGNHISDTTWTSLYHAGSPQRRGKQPPRSVGLRATTKRTRTMRSLRTIHVSLNTIHQRNLRSGGRGAITVDHMFARATGILKKIHQQGGDMSRGMIVIAIHAGWLPLHTTKPTLRNHGTISQCKRAVLRQGAHLSVSMIWFSQERASSVVVAQ